MKPGSAWLKWVLLAVAVLGWSAASVLYTGDGPRIAGAQGIQGRFSPVVSLQAHTLDQVAIDIYSDLTCPACRRLDREAIPQLRARFGNRVTVRMHYLAGPATPPSAKILYDVANDAGKGEVVATALFSAPLNHHQESANLPIVRKLAKRYALEHAFESALSDGSGLTRAKQQWRETHGTVVFFPLVVIQGQIAVDADAANLLRVVDSVLTMDLGVP